MTRAYVVDLERERTNDAILIVALNEYVAECVKEGKQVTELAADRMLPTAERLNLQPPRSLRLLGFRVEGEFIQPLPHETYRRALRRVVDTRNARRAIELAGLFRRRSVDDA